MLYKFNTLSKGWELEVSNWDTDKVCVNCLLSVSENLTRLFEFFFSIPPTLIVIIIIIIVFRVQDGVCYHMFTKARELLLDSYPIPEMLRTRLEEVILQAKMLQLGSIKPFLSKVMNPPNPKAIDLSLKVCNLLFISNRYAMCGTVIISIII